MISKLQIYLVKAFKHPLLCQRWQGVFVVFIALMLLPGVTVAQKGSKIRTVIIDPGHGGKDPGALGKRSKEKDVVLDVALKTGQYIKQNLPDVKVIYTRSKDEFIELHRRASIANENNADVFISIHCNASKSTDVYGAETFVMGEHKNQANLEVAKLENNAILFEENADDEYGGFDPNSNAAYIALSLVQSEYKQQSLSLAQKVQTQFTERVGRKDRSVQQAGFLVLYRTAMPSILVELGFLTNPKEEAFLKSEEGQVYLASAIYRAFKEFKTEFERDNSSPVKLTPEEEEILAPGGRQNVKAPEPQVKKPEPKEAVRKATPKKNMLEYKVQFATFPHEISLTDKRFKDIPVLWSYLHNGIYKYTSGNFSTLNEAVNHQSLLRKQGYADAFVVIFSEGKRITLDEAKIIEKQQLNK